MTSEKHIGFYILIILSFHSLKINADTIKIGMTTALDGPAKSLGLSVKLGVETYFHKINESGGINGRQLELIALDDGYEPNRAAPNMQQLIEQEKVLAVIGNVGTPTAIVTVPIANEHKTLLFGAVTGAGLLRKNPPDRYIINYRASYGEETAAMINGLLASGIKPTEIALFTQKDGYGTAGYNGAMAALKAKGFNDTDKIVHGRYIRNTLNVEGALSDILDTETDPKAIIMIGAYKPCAKFIKLARKHLRKTLFLNVSFVGSLPLLEELGRKTKNVIVTQVIPHFEDESPGVARYREDLQSFNNAINQENKPGFLSLEGYTAAQILVMGLQKADSLNRESIIDALESLDSFDLGIGNNLHISANEHQASHTVWPTRMQGRKFVTFDWKDL